MIGASELAAWLRLLETPGVGRETARRLLRAFGSPEGVFYASHEEWTEAGSPALADALAAEPPDVADLVAAALKWQQADERRDIITLGDAAYPASLLETPDPPLLLYLIGRRELLQRKSVAIVGSRTPSVPGRDNARRFGKVFSEAGLTVVSGLALGIDGAAHEGALEGEGSTIAVVGTGLDRVYPRSHLKLAHRIAEHGLIVSEFPLGAEPLAHHFPARNRIIAGLSLGTLVVEAALQSGSLITARLAAEMGRDVFAMPGSIHTPQARGCHALIKQGAKLVDDPADVLEELGWMGIDLRAPAQAPSAPAEPAAPQDPVLEALGYDPATLDALVARTGSPPHLLNARLLELELDGLVVRLPGGQFQRRTTA